jgi:hypothetical protein
MHRLHGMDGEGGTFHVCVFIRNSHKLLQSINLISQELGFYTR